MGGPGSRGEWAGSGMTTFGTALFFPRATTFGAGPARVGAGDPTCREAGRGKKKGQGPDRALSPFASKSGMSPLKAEDHAGGHEIRRGRLFRHVGQVVGVHGQLESRREAVLRSEADDHRRVVDVDV